MKAQEIIDYLNKQGTWVNWENTRDVILYGDPTIEVNKVGVCWVLTMKALKQAIAEGINFIISHENPYYEATTIHTKRFLLGAEEKRALMQEHNICAIRCHDVWDKIPVVGVSDIWAKTLGFPFKPRDLNSFNMYADFPMMKVRDVALQIAVKLAPYGQDAVQIFGNPDQEITSLVIGTGAAIDVNNMLTKPADALVASDDGCMTYAGIQYCLDHDIPVIRVNHAQSEIPGMLSMVDYLKSNLAVEAIYLPEGYDMTTICAKK